MSEEKSENPVFKREAAKPGYLDILTKQPPLPPVKSVGEMILAGPKHIEYASSEPDVEEEIVEEKVVEPAPIQKKFSIFKFGEAMNFLLEKVKDFFQNLQEIEDGQTQLNENLQTILNAVREVPEKVNNLKLKVSELEEEKASLVENLNKQSELIKELSAEKELQNEVLREILDSRVLFDMEAAYFDLMMALVDKKTLDMPEKRAKLQEIMEKIKILVEKTE